MMEMGAIGKPTASGGRPGHAGCGRFHASRECQERPSKTKGPSAPQAPRARLLTYLYFGGSQ